MIMVIFCFYSVVTHPANSKIRCHPVSPTSETLEPLPIPVNKLTVKMTVATYYLINNKNRYNNSYYTTAVTGGDPLT